ncbi:hypothetical protein BY458DRAFT_514390 [Sporodiniella umbellata]|nr:hypothetical protein BY458DRAFT_514390 [Sporodiniella umbellata]
MAILCIYSLLFFCFYCLSNYIDTCKKNNVYDEALSSKQHFYILCPIHISQQWFLVIFQL